MRTVFLIGEALSKFLQKFSTYYIWPLPTANSWPAMFRPLPSGVGEQEPLANKPTREALLYSEHLSIFIKHSFYSNTKIRLI